MTFMRVVQVPVNDVVVVVAMLTRLVAAGRAVRGMVVVPAVVPASAHRPWFSPGTPRATWTVAGRINHADRISTVVEDANLVE
jgi:hypothetical protein